jgi:glycosyltransferase involved in cell wall biosynthesis
MTSAVRSWSEAMARGGAEVAIAFDGWGDPYEEGGVDWYPVRHSGRRGLKVPLRFKEIVQKADVLVLHSAWTLRNLRAAAIARSLEVPYILEPRGAYDPHIVSRKRMLKRMWWAAWERRLVYEARAVHVFFEPEKAHLHALGYRGPFVIASNGRRAPEGKTWDGGSGDYLLWLGRFDPQHKGLDLLLEAMTRIPADQRPTLKLHGPDWRERKKRVRGLVDQLGLKDRVTVGDAVYGLDKRSLLTRARGFVYPSRWDACPNAVLESVSLGIPTLTGPYPLGRFFEDRNAAFVGAADAGSLADGIKRLMSSDALDVAPIGAEVVRKELSWDDVARSWLVQARELQ